VSDRFSALSLFVRIARTRSFSRAARELGLSQPSASRIIASLEKEIGALLFTRSTRALALTEAGTDYLARVEPALAALEEADYAARGTGELRGRIRVAAPSSFSVRVVIPTLPDFLKTHPKLQVELVMNDQLQALIAEGVDVAFRMGSLADSSATAQRIGRIQRVLVASAAYLRRAGRPKQPSHLSSHELILGPFGTGPEGWTFEKDGRSESFRPQGRVNVSANEGVVAAAAAGLGIACTGMVGSRAELAAGTLVRVLPQWNMGAVDVHAVFPAGRRAKPASRAFAEHVRTALGN
jgi:DNA-binding transcriptional LysR family regulator